MSSNNSGIAKILAIIGGVLVVIDGVFSLLNVALEVLNIDFNVPGGGGFYAGLGATVNAIIVIVLGLLILVATGTVKSSKSNVKFNGITVLILGILALVFGSFLGPILVIIAGIILIL